MHTTVFSGAIVGIQGLVIEVEVDIARGIPAFSVVGLPNAAVREARERVTAAIKNSGSSFPLERITVNLAPADVKKEGSAFDLAIAVGIMLASGQAEATTAKTLFVGELALDGAIRKVPGVLPLLLHARVCGFRRAVVPLGNLDEARVVEGIEVLACATLRAAVAAALAPAPTRGKTDGNDLFDATANGAVVVKRADDPVPPPPSSRAPAIDMADVVGQESAKRALLIAAAGGHHALMVGSPGAGKTMLARRFATILPPLPTARAMETTMIYSIVGLLPNGGLMTTAPFRAPHHSASDAGLIGGGGVPRPGEVTLAHNGVLFLDELPEFRRHVLETLREPLEEGAITISRARNAVTFPARFQMIGAMNPCSCVAILPVAHCCLETGLSWRSGVDRRAAEETEAGSRAEPEGSGPTPGRQPVVATELGERKDQASCSVLPDDNPISGLQPASDAGRFLPRAPQGSPPRQGPVVETAGVASGGLGDDGSGLGERDAPSDEVTLRPTLPFFGSMIIRCEQHDRAYLISRHRKAMNGATMNRRSTPTQYQATVTLTTS